MNYRQLFGLVDHVSSLVCGVGVGVSLSGFGARIATRPCRDMNESLCGKAHRVIGMSRLIYMQRLCINDISGCPSIRAPHCTLCCAVSCPVMTTIPHSPVARGGTTNELHHPPHMFRQPTTRLTCFANPPHLLRCTSSYDRTAAQCDDRDDDDIRRCKSRKAVSRFGRREREWQERRSVTVKENWKSVRCEPRDGGFHRAHDLFVPRVHVLSDLFASFTRKNN